MKTKQYILTTCTLLLLALWIPVALDKLWDLEGFRRTLLQQPFPDWWTGVLYWLLPILELACALLLAFTLFILFGVLGWYEKRPCGCGSVISGLSWEQHLWFNVVFLLISVVGWWLSFRYPRRFAPFPGQAGKIN